jgi:hypothetical protein
VRASLSSSTRSLRVAGALWIGLASTFVSQTSFAQVTSDSAAATSHRAEGAKASKSGDWDRALTEYTAANRATKSASAQQGIALAQYRLKHAGEAYDAYGELLSTYGDAISKIEKMTAEARRKELTSQSGAVTFLVNEPGAEVFIGARDIGTSPIAVPVRVATGGHSVRVTKAGFVPFASDISVAENGALTVNAKLEHESATGHITVKEKTGQALRVLVDAVDVGAAPWEGDVPPGGHDIAGRSSTLAAAPQHVEVARGKRVDVELVAVAQIGHLEVSTSDHKGVIYIDGKVVNEGVFAGDLPAGTHTLAVSREGFVRYEKTFTLADKQSMVETITLNRPEAAASIIKPEGRGDEGIYGGFGVAALFEPGGEGNQIDTGCSALGAYSCTPPAPVGGHVFGYVGYSWNPIGLELMLGGEYDEAAPKAEFNGVLPGNTNPLATGIAREEKFHFYRVGGLGAARVRLQWQTDRIRGSIAAGVGLALKEMIMTRESTATQNGTALTNVTPISSDTYFTPALSFDASIQLRLSPTTAVALGVASWIESAEISGIKSTPARTDQALGAPGYPGTVSIATPAYNYASSPQVFIGPYLGMQFGP